MKMDRGAYRYTKIVATLGPATDSEETLESMILGGVDLIRLNMAHATPEWCKERIARVRKVSEGVLRQVAVMMDVKGPEIRTGKVPSPVLLKPGEMVEFRIEGTEPSEKCDHSVDVNYPDFPKDVEPASTVLVDSGLMRLIVVETDDERVICRVQIGGEMGSKRHINLPGTKVNLPALTKKDRTDLRAGVEAGIDFVALSFVRQAADIDELRSFLEELGSKARIIAKIEDQNGVDNLGAIVRAADGIMVARGDLGIEIDYDRLPIVQKEIVDICRHEGKPVIIATHLLESMISSPVPTRAEISDVSNAIREQADAVMLSGETTTGSYPLEAIEVLRRIIRTNEAVGTDHFNRLIQLREPKAKMLRSAALLAQELGETSGVVVFTRSGFLGYTLGALRARGVPIFAFTDLESTFRQLLFPWGVEPFLMDLDDERPERTIVAALQLLRDRGWAKPGATMVVITNVLVGEQRKIVDSLQLRTIEP